jgi:polyhydroxyalkanoate synthesis regulator phasin
MASRHITIGIRLRPDLNPSARAQERGMNMKSKIFIFVLVLAVALVAGASGVFAQASETDQLQQLRAEIRADRQAVVAANLKLTDAEGQAFWPLYREYHNEIAKVGDRLQKLIQEYAVTYENATPEQAKAMVDEMMSIQRADLKVKESYLPKFRKVLPELKVARFLQIENKIDTLIKMDLAAEIPLIGAPK